MFRKVRDLEVHELTPEKGRIFVVTGVRQGRISHSCTYDEAWMDWNKRRLHAFQNGSYFNDPAPDPNDEWYVPTPVQIQLEEF